MDTNILSPKNLFQKDICYVIPPYQRPYVWEQEDRWAPFWEDVRNTAESYLENLDEVDGDKSRAESKTSPHFLGAVVLQQEPGAIHEVERRHVVDGQQRITTLQLLLDAVQEVYVELNLRTAARRLSKLVQNDDEIYEGNDLFKLFPSIRDRAAFRHAMQNGLATDDYQESLVVQAHEYFQAQTREWIQSDEEHIEKRAGALESAITALIQLVVIDLGVDDNPHIIFETLNARGTRLLDSDLIKNYVVSRVRHEDQGDIWGDLDNDWWRYEVSQGRLFLPRIEVLTNYWLTMRTASDVSSARLFRAFTDYSQQRDVTVVMGDVKHALAQYRTFSTSKDLSAEERLFRYRMQVMDTGVVTPLLLRLISTESVSATEREKALRALESFLVRRMICRFTTKDYNSLVQVLLRNIRDDEIDKAGSSVITSLKEQDADARKWPNDTDVRTGVANLQVYRLLTRSRLRLVLEGIERQLRIESRGKAEQLDVPEGLSIEHVMPRSWEANWPLPDSSGESAAPDRSHLIETLGNLTLTTQKLNSSLSNAPWEQTDVNAKTPGKRKTLDKYCVLYLKTGVVAHESWDEDRIRDRGKELAEIICRAWPGPDSAEWD